MGSLGGAEILLILVLALLLFGPRSLPKIGRTVGKGLAEFRKASNDLRSSLEREVEMEEFREIRDDLNSAKHEVTDTIRQARHLGAQEAPQAESKPPPSDEATGSHSDGDPET
jgi:sec-independent protein translocase protein TatB